MKTIGFPISHKENENRRAIIPEHIPQIKCAEYLVFETNYGKILGYEDDEYLKYGCKTANRDDVLHCDIICDPKVGDAEYLERLAPKTTVFGWIHAVQNKNITDILVARGLTAIAWEDMYEEGRHCFWRNNEIAGEAAILHAYQCYGKMPYNTDVAVIGRGNTARGAIKILTLLGARIVQYDRKTENLLRKEIRQFDVIVNCIFWDVDRSDHILYRKDLSRMKKGAMIIDVSCDRAGGIETSVPTSIANPCYEVDGIIHYVVDHTPSLFYKTFSVDNSKEVCKYLDELSLERHSEIIMNAKIIENGTVLDERIIKYQNR